MSTEVFDVIVVGAGLVGSVCASGLAAAGLKVALVGPAAMPERPAASGGWDPRIYAIAPDCRAFLGGIGIWAQLDAARVMACSAMQIQGDGPGAALRLGAYQAGVPALAYLLESSALGEAALAACAREGVHRVSRTFEALAPGAAGQTGIVLDDGQCLAGRLLVAADGAHSPIREASGIRSEVHDYRQIALVANFAAERHHGGTAYQWFRSPDVLAFLPLPEGLISIVWSLPADRAREYLALPAEQLAARVAEAAGHRLGRLSPLGPAQGFALERRQVSALTARRLALVGDAAHVVHPLAGLGVNLGFRDVRELLKVLTERDRVRDCGDALVLARYARLRAEDILSVSLLTHGLQRLFAARGPAAWTRNAGLKLLERLPWAKGVLMSHALGAA